MNFEVAIKALNPQLTEMCKTFIPKDWNVRVIKGKGQSDFFKEMLNTNYDYVVNLDEDSFLINPEVIIPMIEEMDKKGIVYNGMLDGAQLPMRIANPVSMNPFFDIFNVKKIKEKINYNNYDSIVKEYQNKLTLAVNNGDYSIFDKIDFNKYTGRYQLMLIEGYYYFFYFLYCNFKFEILDARFLDQTIQTDLHVIESQDVTTVLSYKGKDFVYHTWYARHFGVHENHTNRINRIFNIALQNTWFKNTTFIIQYIFDHQDRYENFKYSLNNIKENCPCAKIFVYELGEKKTLQPEDLKGCEYKFKKTKSTDLYHRTKDFNDIIKLIDTKYICLFDCDVFFNREQYIESIQLLENGNNVVYPYNGRFTNIDRKFLETGEIIDVGTWHFEMFGGAVFLNREDYLKAGGENQNIVTYAIDDMERYDRLRILEYKIARTKGACFHINHFRGKNSVPTKEGDFTYKKNEEEWAKIKSMNKEQLQNYIKTWNWLL